MIRELLTDGAGGAAGSTIRYELSGKPNGRMYFVQFPDGTSAKNEQGPLTIGRALRAKRLG